jgi:hypothetical protein
MFEGTEKCLQKAENLEERDHFEDKHIDGKILLNRVKQIGCNGTGWIQWAQLDRWWADTSGFMKQGISWTAQRR